MSQPDDTRYESETDKDLVTGCITVTFRYESRERYPHPPEVKDFVTWALVHREVSCTMVGIDRIYATHGRYVFMPVKAGKVFVKAGEVFVEEALGHFAEYPEPKAEQTWRDRPPLL